MRKCIFVSNMTFWQMLMQVHVFVPDESKPPGSLCGNIPDCLEFFFFFYGQVFDHESQCLSLMDYERGGENWAQKVRPLSFSSLSASLITCCGTGYLDDGYFDSLCDASFYPGR